MLANSKAFQGFSVPDLEAAKKFYGETLGLKVGEDPAGLAITVGGGTTIFAYPKEDHEPATFTILNFPVENIDETVDGLTKRGVSFERYEGFEQDGRRTRIPSTRIPSARRRCRCSSAQRDTMRSPAPSTRCQGTSSSVRRR